MQYAIGAASQPPPYLADHPKRADTQQQGGGFGDGVAAKTLIALVASW
jgi:hypothetical protein